MTDPSPRPVTPDEVPDAVLDAALAAYLGPVITASSETREALRPAIAAALTVARDLLADWISRERVLTNSEITAVIKAHDDDGDCGAVHLAYCARLARVWPGGYR